MLVLRGRTVCVRDASPFVPDLWRSIWTYGTSSNTFQYALLHMSIRFQEVPVSSPSLSGRK